MKLIIGEGDRYVLNAERGEELVGALLTFVGEREIAAATLTGLGAADNLELAYYNLAAKSYERHMIDEEVEILSLVSNLAELDGEKIFHIHGTFGKRDLSTFGGHVFSLRVSGACEIHLTALSQPIK